MEEFESFDPTLFADDYNVWEEEQVFLDHEGYDEPADPETDFPEPEMDWEE